LTEALGVILKLASTGSALIALMALFIKASACDSSWAERPGADGVLRAGAKVFIVPERSVEIS
jgi:hypothetical protein